MLKKKEIHSFPNPTNNEVNVEIPKGCSVLFVTDVSGKILMNWEKPDSTVRIQLGSYSRGTYFIHCIKKDKKLTSKIMLIK